MTVAGGLALATVGLSVLATITPASSYSTLLWAMLLLGVGVGSAYTAGTDSVIGAVLAEQAGAASATNEMSLELGTALGIAILGSVLSSQYSSAVRTMSNLPEAVRGTVAESIGAAVRVANELGGAAGPVLLEQARSAFTGAMQTTTLLGMGIALLGVLLAVFYLPGRGAQKAPPTATASS